MALASILRVAALCALIWPMVARAQGPAPTAPPRDAVVALVLTNGKLLPLAAGSRGGWHLLPWPQHESQDDQPAPPVPAAAGAIPKEWFAPLRDLPATWRLQPIDGRPRTIQSGVPTRWEIATFDAIGLSTDYVDTANKDFAFDAGLAASGDVEALPVRRLSAASAEWHEIVATFAGAFVEAERRGARSGSSTRRVPTAQALAKGLLSAEVELWQVSDAGGRAYFYFDARRRVTGEQDSCILEMYHRGLITREGGRLTKNWMSALNDGCEDPPQVMEIIGGFRAAGRSRLVAKYSGDDWETYALLDPADPRAEFQGPR